MRDLRNTTQNFQAEEGRIGFSKQRTMDQIIQKLKRKYMRITGEKYITKKWRNMTCKLKKYRNEITFFQFHIFV